MSLMSLLMGMPTLGSANNVLGNSGMDARMGGSPFSLGDNPFAGLTRSFDEGTSPHIDNWMSRMLPSLEDWLGKTAPHKPSVGGNFPMSGPPIVGGEQNPPAPDMNSENGLKWWKAPEGLPQYPGNPPQDTSKLNKKIGLTLLPGVGSIHTNAPKVGAPVHSPANDRYPKGVVPLKTGFEPDADLAAQFAEADKARAAQAQPNKRPMPDAYKRTGMSQATWDAMNVPDNAPAASPSAKSKKTVAEEAPAAQSAGGGTSDAAIVSATIPHLITAESGGRGSAKNPLSSARGYGQWLNGTWAGLMRRHPELGLTANGRGNKAQEMRALQAFGEENVAYLRRHGINNITPGAVYAAHFLGNGGAADVLHSPDGVMVRDVVSPGVLAANPFLKGMTVGQFKAWTEHKMGGKVAEGAMGDAANASGAVSAPGFDTEGSAVGSGVDFGGQKGHGGGEGGGMDLSQEQLSPQVEPQIMTHADRLRILQQFMSMAGFTPEEIG